MLVSHISVASFITFVAPGFFRLAFLKWCKSKPTHSGANLHERNYAISPCKSSSHAQRTPSRFCMFSYHWIIEVLLHIYKDAIRVCQHLAAEIRSEEAKSWDHQDPWTCSVCGLMVATGGTGWCDEKGQLLNRIQMMGHHNVNFCFLISLITVMLK